MNPQHVIRTTNPLATWCGETPRPTTTTAPECRNCEAAIRLGDTIADEIQRARDALRTRARPKGAD